MKIGFVGLGIMGESMSENIVKKHDDEVYVFDFVKEKVELLESKGAIGCSSSLELAEKSDVIYQWFLSQNIRWLFIRRFYRHLMIRSSVLI